MTAGWAVLLLVLAVVSVRRDRPTVPDQLDLADAVPAVDRATGAVLAAVGADAVVELGPLVITRDCRITPVRPGGEATRDVTVHVRRGEGVAALRAVATSLPADYRARVGPGGAGARQVLRADAGDFIVLRGTAAGDDGEVVDLRASTGCRPLGPAPAPTDPPGTSLPAGPPGGSAPGALTAAVRALGLSPVAVTTRSVPCPGGGTARAATVRSGPPPVSLERALEPVTADATVVRAAPGGYAYRTGPDSVVISVIDGQAQVTATTTC